MIADVDPAAIQTTIEELSAIETRYHSTPTGRTVVDYLVSKYQELAGDRTDVQVEAFDHGSATGQRSLVVRILGQQSPTELIVLGSHIDSVNWEDGSRTRAPGVDDNASGTATNLEVFRQLMQSDVRLARTLEIHGYAAEEVGLVGSQDIASKYIRAGKNVVAMVQFDMNLYKTPGTADKIWLVTNNTNATLNGALRTLAGHYSGVEVGEGRLTAGSSDHASWTRQGVAAAFPFEHPTDHNQHIHTMDDTIENSGAFTQAAAFAKLGVGYIAHFGGML
jgi:leucyl aminopeptidase